MKACDLCSFNKDGQCTHTYRYVFIITPTGGQVDFILTPGMVPTELEEDVKVYMENLTNFIMLPLIDKAPFWEQIREYQKEHSEAKHCPGREEKKEGCHLRVV